MSDVTKPSECPGTGEGQRDLVPLYLAGKLTEDEAEAFEAHYFGCPRCREDVRAGAALRELYGKEAVAASRGRAPTTRRAWLPFAAAAAIAFVGLAVWQLGRPRDEAAGRPVLRGTSAEVLRVEIEAAAQGGIDLSWPAHPDAATYEVEIFASSGARVWGTEVHEPRLSIGAGVVPAPEPGQPFEVEVRALDPMRQVVASSEPTPLQSPR
jgi:hypothetical protein